MKTETILVNATKAAELLKRNTDNRAVRAGHVEALRASFERGEYVMTHQGIAFDDGGALLDGQHRLMAIAQLPQHLVFPMLMTTGMPREQAFGVIDTASAIRNTADVLGMDRQRVEVGSFFARIYAGRSFGVTPTYTRPFVDLTGPIVDEIHAFCGTRCRTWSAAPVRAAAVLSILQGKSEDYVKMVYRALVLADFASMPPVAASLFRSNLSGKVRAGNGMDIFARGLRVFDPKNATHTKIQIKSLADVSTELREYLRGILVLPQSITKENAPAKAEAKKVNTHVHSIAVRRAVGRD